MKTNTHRIATALFAFASISVPHVLHAQGSLTPPPGPPAPVMHTLNEIYDKAVTVENQNNTQTSKLDAIQARTETRIPLVAGSPGVGIQANGTMEILSPGSYYLTGNRTISADGINGLQIVANNVTVDLNGFALINTTGNGGAAISVGTGDAMVHIKNGTIRGGSYVTSGTFTKRGWRDGIASGSRNIWVTDVMVIGAREDGISGYHGIVERCVVDACGETGIWARKVSDSVARSCGGWGISSAGNNDNGIITNCYGESLSISTQSAGIAANGGTVTNSVGISVNWFGIVADSASHCKGISTSGTGLAVDIADNCRGESTSGVGLDSSVATNCMAYTTSGSFAIRCKTASFCRATRTGGTAIFADIAIGCTSVGGTISAAQKHLGTP